MIKLGYGSDSVIVSLTRAEFRNLAGKPYDEVADGFDVNLAPLKTKLDLIDNKRTALGELKILAIDVHNKLTEIGV